MGRRSRTPADLRQLMRILRRSGELVEIQAEVDPFLEIAEVHRRVAAAAGPALLFRRVSGSRLPVVTNLFGTRARAELAFGGGAAERVAGFVEFLETGFPPTLRTVWRERSRLLELIRLGTRCVDAGPVLEVREDEPDLRRLPALTCWPEDGGPFLTLPLVFTESPSGRGGNLGMYRMQVHGPRLAGMHWQIGKGGGFHYAEAEKAGQALPVAVALGGPPAMIVSAIAPLPENVPELLLASFLLGDRVKVCRVGGGVKVPADAEIVFWGSVPPNERHAEGPFGDHYGYYSLEHDYPVFRVEGMTRRRDAVFPATVVGKPRQEDYYIGELLQELLSPVLPALMPSVRSLWSYGETGFHALAAARVDERYEREAMAAGFRILGEGQLALTKFLFLTDSPVDLRDFGSTLEAVLSRTNPARDLHVFGQLAMDSLDYTGPKVNRGSKGLWMGLGEPVRDLPAALEGLELPRGFSDPSVFCAGCLAVGGPAFDEEPDAAARLTTAAALSGWPLVILVDDAKATTRSVAAFLWTVFTRFEPAADIHARDEKLVAHAVCRSFPIVIDARMKPWYPGEVSCDPETARLVDRRWDEYFADGQVEMGDSDEAHLGPGF